MSSRDWLMTVIGGLVVFCIGLAIQKTWEEHEADAPLRPLDRYSGPLDSINPPPFSVLEPQGTDHIIENPSPRIRLIHGAWFVVEKVQRPAGPLAGDAVVVDEIVFRPENYVPQYNAYYVQLGNIKIPANDDAVDIRVWIVDPARTGWLYTGHLVLLYGDPNSPQQARCGTSTVKVVASKPQGHR